jgi:hypothetical protein
MLMPMPIPVQGLGIHGRMTIPVSSVLPFQVPVDNAMWMSVTVRRLFVIF